MVLDNVSLPILTSFHLPGFFLFVSFVFNLPSNFATLNPIALRLCNALKVYPWPVKNRK